VAAEDPFPSIAPRRVAFDHGQVILDPGPADGVLAELLSPAAPCFEGLRRLRARVKALGEERPLRCLGLVGATPDEGTTAVALGLAAALAQESDRRVLVIEAAVRQPALEKVLGLPGSPGLTDWLDSPGDERVPLRRLAKWGFDLLTAGRPLPTPGERLGSDRMAQLLFAARDDFDYVIVDCPALETTADALTLQDLLDGFILVVRERHASRDVIRQAFSHLKPERVRGVVFNDRTEMLTRWVDRRRKT
jgi:Mrp family chromosome partitioning ATPase